MSLSVLAFFLAYFVRTLPSVQSYFLPTLEKFGYYWWFALAVVPIWAIVFLALGVYRRSAPRTLRGQLVLMFCGILLGGATLMTLLLLATGHEFSRSLILIFLLADFFLLGLKTIVGWHLGRRTQPYRILIVGTLEKAREFFDVMKGQEYHGVECAGILCIDDSPKHKEEEAVPMIGVVSQLCEVLDTKQIEGVVFSVPADRMGSLAEAVRSCEEVGVRIYFDLAIDGLQFAKGTTGSIGGKPLLAFQPRPVARR